MHFEDLLFIPPDHNIHSQVSWCTGAGRSVSATRRWSDYSCLNSKLGGRYWLHTSTYANMHMLAHVSVHKSFRRNTNEGSAWLSAYFQKAASQKHKQTVQFALEQLQFATPTCLQGPPSHSGSLLSLLFLISLFHSAFFFPYFSSLLWVVLVKVSYIIKSASHFLFVVIVEARSPSNLRGHHKANQILHWEHSTLPQTANHIAGILLSSR